MRVCGRATAERDARCCFGSGPCRRVGSAVGYDMSNTIVAACIDKPPLTICNWFCTKSQTAPRPTSGRVDNTLSANATEIDPRLDPRPNSPQSFWQVSTVRPSLRPFLCTSALCRRVSSRATRSAALPAGNLKKKQPSDPRRYLRRIHYAMQSRRGPGAGLGSSAGGPSPD